MAEVRMFLFVVGALVSNAVPAAAISREAGEEVATFLNLQGFLCAEVVDYRELRNNRFEITCIEYRGGSGTVRYILDMDRKVAFPAGN